MYRVCTSVMFHLSTILLFIAIVPNQQLAYSQDFGNRDLANKEFCIKLNELLEIGDVNAADAMLSQPDLLQIANSPEHSQLNFLLRSPLWLGSNDQSFMLPEKKAVPEYLIGDTLGSPGKEYPIQHVANNTPLAIELSVDTFEFVIKNNALRAWNSSGEFGDELRKSIKHAGEERGDTTDWLWLCSRNPSDWQVLSDHSKILLLCAKVFVAAFEVWKCPTDDATFEIHYLDSVGARQTLPWHPEKSQIIEATIQGKPYALTLSEILNSGGLQFMTPERPPNSDDITLFKKLFVNAKDFDFGDDEFDFRRVDAITLTACVEAYLINNKPTYLIMYPDWIKKAVPADPDSFGTMNNFWAINYPIELRREFEIAQVFLPNAGIKRIEKLRGISTRLDLALDVNLLMYYFSELESQEKKTAIRFKAVQDAFLIKEEDWNQLHLLTKLKLDWRFQRFDAAKKLWRSCLAKVRD